MSSDNPTTDHPDDASRTVAHGAAAAAGPPALADYDLLGPLGEGGMGVVYKARHRALKRLVALKLVRAAAATDRDRLRFRAEVEAVARLQHPGIVGIYEVGEANGQPFCALEFVEGGSLDRKLAGQPLAPKKAARLAESLARAAHAVHELNLVHRDLKPANVLLHGRPDDPIERCTPKISDFGLAKALDGEAGSSVTHEGSVLGTPAYMAPEQAAGKKDIDRRADVYALGAILYEMLTGRPPIKGDSLSETLWKVLNEEPVSPRRLERGVDRDLEIITLKCLEKEPGRRFATAADLADELERYLNEEPILTRSVGPGERLLKWARRRPAAAAAVALTLLVAVLGAAGAFAGWQWLQAEAARNQAEALRQQAEEANAGLARQTRLAEEAQGWAQQDRLKFEAELKKAREPLTSAEARLRKEFEADRKRLTRGFSLNQIDLAHRAWRSNQLARARQVLDACPTDGVGWEYGYVERLCHGPALPLVRQMVGKIAHLAFSPDGTRLAAADDRGVFVWDYPARTNPLLLAYTSSWVCFTPDGKRLAIAQDIGVRLFDAKTGNLERTLPTPGVDAVHQLAFRPDGSHLAVLDHGKPDVVVLDVATGKPAFTLPGHHPGPLAVAYSPDGTRLATATNDGFRLWDAATGKELHAVRASVAGHRHPLAFDRDGRRVACIDGGAVGAWDAATGERLAHVRTPHTVVRCAAFTTTGELITGGSDTTVRIWTTKGQPVLILRGLPGEVEAFAVSPAGGALVARDRDGNAAVWDPTINQEVREYPHPAEVSDLAFAPDGKRLALATGGKLALLDLATGKEAPLAADAHAVVCGGRWLACVGTAGLVVLDASTNREAWRLVEPVQAFDLGRAGDRLVVLGKQLTVRDPATGKVLVTCEGYAGKGTDVAHAGDDRVVVLGDRVLHFYDARTGKLLASRPVPELQSVAVSPDGKRFAGVSHGRAVIGDSDTGTVTRTLAHVSLVSAVAFSADGRRLATGGWDRHVQVWDVETGQPALSLPIGGGTIRRLAFSADGRWLASISSDSTVRLWDAGPQERK